MSEAAQLRPSPKRGEAGDGGEEARAPSPVTRFASERIAAGYVPTPVPTPERAGESSRLDLLLVADMVEPGSRVLDVGCGDGSLLALLRDRRNVDGRGIELSRDGVSQSMAKGLPVIQGDADTDLADYPDDAFDYVILSQTIQA